MQTSTFEASADRFAWPTLFKIAAATVFAFGAFLHATRLVIGVENVVRYVITPPVDVAFAFVMLLAAGAGAISWARYSGSRAGRYAYGLMMFLLIVSLPLHLRTMVTWSTDLLVAFPTWYSAIEVPMFLALSYGAARLRFNGV